MYSSDKLKIVSTIQRSLEELVGVVELRLSSAIVIKLVNERVFCLLAKQIRVAIEFLVDWFYAS